MPRLAKVVGMDPSMSNWGIAIGTLDIDKGYFNIDSVHVISPNKYKSIKARQNTKDVLLAQDLYKELMYLIKDADIIFAEVPVGSQSSRACVSYGICVALVAAVNISTAIKVIEVTPSDVKKVVGNDNPSKQEMIDWAIEQHPETPFPLVKYDGCYYINQSKSEHMADAIAAIYAGVKYPAFKNLINSLRENK